MSDIAKPKVVRRTERFVVERNWTWDHGIEEGNQTPRGFKREEMLSGWEGPPSWDGWRYEEVKPGERIRRSKDVTKGVR